MTKKDKDKHPLYTIHEIPSGPNSDPDSMGDLFRDAKAYFREKRQANLAEALDCFDEVKRITGANIDINPDSHTWQFRFMGKVLQYYPTRGKWQWKNKVYHGGIQSFIGWLRNNLQERG